MCDELLVGRRAGGRHDLDRPEGLTECPERTGQHVDQNAHLEEGAGEHEHQWHDVEHGLLRLNHRVVRIHCRWHVANHRHAHGVELQANHHDNRDDEDGDGNSAITGSNGVRQRDTENSRAVDVGCDCLGDRTEMIGFDAGVLVGACC